MHDATTIAEIPSLLCVAGDREQWDFGRFVKTVTYFNKPPTPEDVLRKLAEQPAKLVRQLTGTEEVRPLLARGSMLLDCRLVCNTACCACAGEKLSHPDFADTERN